MFCLEAFEGTGSSSALGAHCVGNQGGAGPLGRAVLFPAALPSVPPVNGRERGQGSVTWKILAQPVHLLPFFLQALSSCKATVALALLCSCKLCPSGRHWTAGLKLDFVAETSARIV